MNSNTLLQYNYLLAFSVCVVARAATLLLLALHAEAFRDLTNSQIASKNVVRLCASALCAVSALAFLACPRSCGPCLTSSSAPPPLPRCTPMTRAMRVACLLWSALRLPTRRTERPEEMAVFRAASVPLQRFSRSRACSPTRGSSPRTWKRRGRTT